jgi:DNA-binding transcriptional MerR regulator
MDKSPDAFRTISEVAEDLDLPQHVLRFWETRFTHIRPLKRGGGRRYYRPDDVDLLKGIRHLLYGEGYTIRGVQRILKEEGVRFVQSVGRGEQSVAAPSGAEREIVAGFAPSLDEGNDGTDFAPEAPAVQRHHRHEEHRRQVSGPMLSPSDIGRLKGVLADLKECERVLSALTTPPDMASLESEDSLTEDED